MKNVVSTGAAVFIGLCAWVSVQAAGPPFVDITWMSMSNVYYELGSLRILTDGYITRLPQSAFSGGGGGLATTRQPFKPDVEAVRRVMTALAGNGRENPGRPVHVGQRWASGCRCPQTGGPRAHDPGTREPRPGGGIERIIEVAVPGEQQVDARRAANLRAGVAEDFPNGGGNRAFLFVVDGPAGRFSWFFQNSASAADLHVPIMVGATNYGAPLDNLKAALADEGLDAVDLWIGRVAIAQLVVPVLKPKAYLPVH